MIEQGSECGAVRVIRSSRTGNPTKLLLHGQPWFDVQCALAQQTWHQQRHQLGAQHSNTRASYAHYTDACSWACRCFDEGFHFSSKPVLAHSMTTFIPVGVQRQWQAARLAPTETIANGYSNLQCNLQLRYSAILTPATYLCQPIALEVLLRGLLKATRVLVPALCQASW